MLKPFVSVVIPVLNDLEGLSKCLNALEKQTYPRQNYEIIIVDNGSEKDISAITSLFDNVTLIRENYPTSSAARNKGISIARGEVLAFTDADCIPDREWIENGVKSILSIQNYGLVGGNVEIFVKNPKKITGTELFEKITAFKQEEYITKLHFSTSANAFILKEVIEKVGLFDNTLKSGADLEWGKRIFQAGYKQVYASNAKVMHPARRTLKQVLKKHARVVGGLYDISQKRDYTLTQFIIDLKDDWPRLSDFLDVFKGKKLRIFQQKIKVASIMFFVKFVRVSERVRLRLGGKSKRC